MTKLAAIALTALLSACSLYVGDGGEPDAAASLDAASTECEGFCAWQYGLTGANVEICVAECEAADCADCCTTTPRWPECS